MAFVSFGDYLTLPRTPETWIVEDILPVSGLCNIYSKAKLGKSYLALGMAIAISQSHPEWLNFPVHTHGTVAYIQIDTPPNLWFDSYVSRVSLLVPNKSTIQIVDQAMVPYPFNVLENRRVDEHGTIHLAGAAWLKAQLAALNPRPVAVIVDTIRDAHGGDENDSGHMRNVMVAMVDACRPSALVIISHSRKDYQGIPEDIINDGRGSNYIAGRMDCIIRLSGEDSKADMVYQSRTAAGRIPMTRDPETGLWLASLSPREVIKDVLSALPYASQNAQAEVVAHRLGISHRTAVRRIKEFTANRP